MTAFFAPEVIEQALYALDNGYDPAHPARAVGDAQEIVDALRAAGFRLLRQEVEDTAVVDRLDAVSKAMSRAVGMAMAAGLQTDLVSGLVDAGCALDDIVNDLQAAAPDPSPDTATAILAGLIETVRVMRDNAYAKALIPLGTAYDEVAGLLLEAAGLLPPPAVEFDAATNPLDRIVDEAEEERR